MKKTNGDWDYRVCFAGNMNKLELLRDDHANYGDYPTVIIAQSWHGRIICKIISTNAIFTNVNMTEPLAYDEFKDRIKRSELRILLKAIAKYKNIG